MALGDYILCCKCEGKLIYDGDRGSREWWKERFGSEPQIICPDCEKTKRFAELVRADEREACAKVADAYANGLERNYSEIIADTIRARGQA